MQHFTGSQMKNSAINFEKLLMTALITVIIVLSPRDTISQGISGSTGSSNIISNEYALINDYASAEINSLFKNKSLETLIINDETISSINPEIKSLYLLKVLDLAHTQIDALPEEISQLRSLEEIHLNYELWQYKLDDVKRITRAKIVIE